MNYIVPKPQLLFFMLSVLLLLVSFFFPLGNLDIHLHDTYFITPSEIYLRWLALAMALLGGLYILCPKILAFRLLTTLHVAMTTALVVLIIVLAFLQPAPIGEDLFEFVNHAKWVVITFIVLMLTQLAFLINVVLGISKLFRRKVDHG